MRFVKNLGSKVLRVFQTVTTISRGCKHEQAKTLTFCDSLPKVSVWHRGDDGGFEDTGDGGTWPPTTSPHQWPGGGISHAVTRCPLRPATTASPSQPLGAGVDVPHDM